MKNIITAILACLVCFASLAFSSCKKETPVKLELHSAENTYPVVNPDNFSGTDMDEFSASLKEIKTSDDKFRMYSTTYNKIISDDVGVYIPADEEMITYLGVDCYQPLGGCGLLVNDEGLVDYVEIRTRCIFTCGGVEYEANFYTYNDDSSLTTNNAVEAFELDGREARLVTSKVFGKKCVLSCRYKDGDDTVIIMPTSGDFLENTELTNLPEDIFELLDILNLKKVGLKELID